MSNKIRVLIALWLAMCFGVGYYVGGSQVKEVERVVEKKVETPFLDLTLSREEQLQRLNVYANTLDLAVVDEEEQEVLESKRNYIEGLQHKYWQSGYMEGYKAGARGNQDF